MVERRTFPLFFVFGQNYSPETLLKLNAATWTLAVEVAFYLMLPVVGCRAALLPAAAARRLLLRRSSRSGSAWNLARLRARLGAGRRATRRPRSCPTSRAACWWRWWSRAERPRRPIARQTGERIARAGRGHDAPRERLLARADRIAEQLPDGDVRGPGRPRSRSPRSSPRWCSGPAPGFVGSACRPMAWIGRSHTASISGTSR